jgi:hypothetical protein
MVLYGKKPVFIRGGRDLLVTAGSRELRHSVPGDAKKSEEYWWMELRPLSSILSSDGNYVAPPRCEIVKRQAVSASSAKAK